MLRYLCSSQSIFIDGTFKVVPSIFTQLYTIHGMAYGQVKFFAFKICMIAETHYLLWNHYQNSGARTTNNAESFHSLLNRSIGKAHVNIYELIESLMSIQKDNDIRVRELMKGNFTPKVSIKYRRLNNKIVQLKTNFSRGQMPLLQYMHYISEVFSLDKWCTYIKFSSMFCVILIWQAILGNIRIYYTLHFLFYIHFCEHSNFINKKLAIFIYQYQN